MKKEQQHKQCPTLKEKYNKTQNSLAIQLTNTNIPEPVMAFGAALELDTHSVKLSDRSLETNLFDLPKLEIFLLFALECVILSLKNQLATVK